MLTQPCSFPQVSPNATQYFGNDTTDDEKENEIHWTPNAVGRLCAANRNNWDTPPSLQWPPENHPEPVNCPLRIGLSFDRPGRS